MPWVRFDDNTSEDPKVDHLSDGAFRLWFNAICFANRNLTDGFVPTARLTRLTPNYRPSHLEQLCEAGMFHKEHDGITVHGYLTYQLSAEEIQAQREQARERQARARAKKVRGDNGRYLSQGESRRDIQRDDDRDSRRDSRCESHQPHPTPPQVPNKSSSSEPLVGPATEEEEAVIKEAKRRLLATTTHINDPDAWVRTTAGRLRDAGWTPTTAAPQRDHPLGTPAPRPDCATCDGLSLVEHDGGYQPCPTCTRSESA